MNKKIILISIIVLLSFNFVNAQTLTSGVGVEYDAELKGQFLLNEWVYVTVDIKDTSNITTPHRTSPDFKEKITERTIFLTNISDSVLSTLSEDEFKLKGKITSGLGFSGNITKKGFNKLLNDTRVRKIYAEKHFKLHSSVSSQISFGIFYLIIFIVVLIIIIKLIKRKWKIKK
jgi:hypothetical protein